MREGEVTFFNLKSRFGFIKENSTGTDYYFYIKNPSETIVKGDKVTFEIRQAKKGMEAYSVKIIAKN